MRRPIITKAQQIMSARQKIATFRANEHLPAVDYRTPLEKERQGVRATPCATDQITNTGDR